MLFVQLVENRQTIRVMNTGVIVSIIIQWIRMWNRRWICLYIKGSIALIRSLYFCRNKSNSIR
jgi:hypothetical protein